MGNHAVMSDNGATVVDEDKYAISAAWQRGREFCLPFDYRLENTGQWVNIRRLDMGDLLKMDITEELDFMTKELLNTDKKDDKEAVASAITKASNFQNMEKMINFVVLAGVLKPKLYKPPLHENARQAGLIYVDSIPFNDRIELFSVIFETEGLSTFREEQETGMGDVEHVQSVQLPADRSMAEL